MLDPPSLLRSNLFAAWINLAWLRRFSFPEKKKKKMKKKVGGKEKKHRLFFFSSFKISPAAPTKQFLACFIRKIAHCIGGKRCLTQSCSHSDRDEFLYDCS